MCRQFASGQSGGNESAQAATNNAIGYCRGRHCAVGAGIGAALGLLSGQTGAGAAVGAATRARWLAVRLSERRATVSAADLQQRYDASYTAMACTLHGDLGT